MTTATDTESGSAGHPPRPSKPATPRWTNIPNELQEIPRWVCWRYEYRGGDWTKQPKMPDGSPASHSDPATWSSFADCQRAYEQGAMDFDGVGFVLTDEDGDTIVAWDFDHCFDKAGKCSETVQGYAVTLNGYIEKSPSGEGLRILVRGKLPPKGRKRGGSECYETLRYMTITGAKLAGSDIENIPERQAEIDEVHALIFAKPDRPQAARPQPSANGALTDDELFDAIDRSTTKAKFDALYFDGNWQGEGYPSPSEADLALANRLSFWVGGDAGEIRRLMYESALKRDKWDTHASYLRETIDLAVPQQNYYKRPHRNGGPPPHEEAARPEPEQESRHEAPPHEEQQQAGQGATPDDDAWLDPDLTLRNDAVRPAPDCPVELIPSWEQRLRNVAAAAGAPVDYVLGAFLVVVASVIGNTRIVYILGSWFEPLLLWMGLVGPPGTSKSPAATPILKAVARREEEMLEGFDKVLRAWKGKEIAAQALYDDWEKKVKEWAAKGSNGIPPPMPATAVAPDKPQPPRIKIEDATPEALARAVFDHPRGLLSYHDELAGLIGGFGRYHDNSSSERALYLKGYDATSHNVDRIKHDTPVNIKRFYVGLGGGIQPTKFEKMLGQQDDNDGLAARPLYVWPDRIPRKRPEIVVDEMKLLKALRYLQTLDFKDGEPQVMTLTEVAAAHSSNGGWRMLRS